MRSTLTMASNPLEVAMGAVRLLIGHGIQEAWFLICFPDGPPTCVGSILHCPGIA